MTKDKLAAIRRKITDDSGMIDVAMAIGALCIVLVFSFYLLEVTAVSARYQSALSESLRNLARTIQQSSVPLTPAEVIAISDITLGALGIPASNLGVSVLASPSCNAETVTLWISNPLLPLNRITSSTTQTVSLSTGCA